MATKWVYKVTNHDGVYIFVACETIAQAASVGCKQLSGVKTVEQMDEPDMASLMIVHTVD
jgi:hypothetical protein